MDFNEYQQLAVSTAIYPADNGLVYTTLGLTGEAGEVAEKVKKILRDKDGHVDHKANYELASELGDVLWYAANLASELGFNFETVAQMNVDKLQSRKDRGMLQGSGDNR